MHFIYYHNLLLRLLNDKLLSVFIIVWMDPKAVEWIYITEPPNKINKIFIVMIQSTHSPLQNSTANSFSTSPMILPGRAPTTTSSLTLLGCTVITLFYNIILAVLHVYHCRVLSHSLQYIMVVFWCIHQTHVWEPIGDIVSVQRRTRTQTHTHEHRHTEAHTHTHIHTQSCSYVLQYT